MPSRVGGSNPVATPIVRPAGQSPVIAPAAPKADGFVGGGAPKGTIETVFTPGDAAKKMELQAIDEVIAARKADSKKYGAAENPYRIEYAIYNMTDRDVIARLIDAKKAGISVQVLIEAAQISPEKPFNTVVDQLTKGGFSHAQTQKGLSDEQRQTTDIIEIDLPGQGIFHFKSRYFTWPDPVGGAKREVLLTGSHNPQTTAHKNDESLHRITDPRLVHRYVDAFHALRDEQPVNNAWDDSEPVNALFASPTATGPKPVDKIFELIDQEQELIFLTLFNFRALENSSGEKIADRLIAAKNRGVPVVLVTDLKGSANDPTDDALKAAGIPVYEYVNPTSDRTAMHLKSALFGLSDMKVVTDTGNWTLATMGKGGGKSKNAESLLFIDSGKYDQNHTGERYLGEFLRVTRRYADQNGPDRKPVEELVSELQQLPSWPQVEVSFDKVAGALAPGQQLQVTAPQLAGGRLTFTPGQPSAPTLLPLGLKLDYRVGADGTPGEPAMTVIDPTESRDTDRLTVEVP